MLGALAGLAGMLAIAACLNAQEVPLPARQVIEFGEPGVSFDNRFAGARLDDCSQEDEAEFRVLIRPEKTPINNSAWYAFRVRSAGARTITVRLSYEGGTHRYHPKISRDGVHWTVLGPDAYTRGENRREATLRLDVGPEPLWVAGQELVTSEDLNAWGEQIARRPFVRRELLGRSLLGKPIYKLRITGAKEPGYVFIIGRQHPPEVTGSLGLMHFVETLVADTDLARQFRARFDVIVVPLVNPDGVDHGLWRSNQNGIDLNRDWDRFTQPETRALRDGLLHFTSPGGPRLYLFLDFHSTHHDVFYTQPDSAKTFPEGFTRKWLEAIQARFPDYQLRRGASVGGKSKTSKRWGYQVLGVPAITYEFGDDTDRELLARITRGAAEEMMRLLLAEVGAAEAGAPKDRAALRRHFPSKCLLNHATVASLARLPSSPRNPCSAPSITKSSQGTFFLPNSTSIFSLWSIGTSSSLSPWTNSVGASSWLTCRIGEQSPAFSGSN
jgi:murein tripeptide amidase MpaA